MFEAFEHSNFEFCFGLRYSNFGFIDLTETPGWQSLLGSHQQSWRFNVINQLPVAV